MGGRMRWAVLRRAALLLALTSCVLVLVDAWPSIGAPRNPRHDTDLVPGWMGSDYTSPETLAGRGAHMKVLSADARIFLFEKFLTAEECDAIVALAEPRLVRSGVIEQAKSDALNTTLTSVSKIRTSHGMFFARAENELIKSVEQRMAAWSLTPAVNGEGLQVLRYQAGKDGGEGDKYEPHWDYFFHKEGTANGGNRYATVLTYLADVEEGGETVFPFLPAPGGENAGFSECARKHLAVKPRKGDAVLFHSIAPNGAFERRSMHGSCPVIKGTKWSMAKWIHVSRFVTDGSPLQRIEQTTHEVPSDKAECPDQHANCDSWALSGECYKNAVWMVGSADKPGQCMQSCRRCDVWRAAQAAQQQQPDAVHQQRQEMMAQADALQKQQQQACQDLHTLCGEWALGGECQKNLVWMVGSADTPGHCLHSCKRCDVWQGVPLAQQQQLLAAAQAKAGSAGTVAAGSSLQAGGAGSSSVATARKAS